jgi:hypothetical protein
MEDYLQLRFESAQRSVKERKVVLIEQLPNIGQRPKQSTPQLLDLIIQKV